MRIAHVAPLAESVPPQLYGGTERVVAFLVEAMAGLGHEVTLFASADSVTSAVLRPCCPRALRLDGTCREPLAYELLMMTEVLASAQEFDIIHFHTNLVQFPLFRGYDLPCLTTLHGRLDMAELVAFFSVFRQMPLVAISDAQRTPVRGANWIGTVHHGLPESLLPPGGGNGGYLAFLGRFSPEKQPDAAIRIARRAGLPLKLAAKIDPADTAYFDAVVRPLLTLSGVEWIGEIGETEKPAFLGDARALLFPIGWPEPFGLVMIEAMACGTPVIAFPCGSVPEIIEDGVTGFIVEDEAAAVAALDRIDQLDRRRIRQVFERRFSATRMARDYLVVYEGLLGGARPIRSRRRLDTSRGELEHA